MSQEMFARFKRKDEALRSALQRVKDKLNAIADSFNSAGEIDPNWDRVHTLEYRLEQRLCENNGNYGEAHLDAFGFN